MKTFDNYTPRHETQKAAKAKMMRLAVSLMGSHESRMKLIGPEPYDRPRVITLTGEPGLGKTHLLIALYNKLREVEGAQIVYSAEKFNTEVMGGNAHVKWTKNCAVILLDDVWSDKQDIGSFDADAMMRFLMEVYKTNRTVVMSSNFTIDQIVAAIRSVDKIGRVSSRLTEMSSGCGDIHIAGEDYRKVLAQQQTSAFDF